MNKSYYFSSAWAHDFSFDEIEAWLDSGWIEELEEFEFIKKDMRLFGQQCAAEWQKHKLLYVENELVKYSDSN